MSSPLQPAGRAPVKEVRSSPDKIVGRKEKCKKIHVRSGRRSSTQGRNAQEDCGYCRKKKACGQSEATTRYRGN